MMPAAALFLAAALVLALALARSRMGAPGEAEASPSFIGDAGEGDAAPGPSVAGAADTVFAAGQAVLDTVGAAVKRIFTLPASAEPYADTIRAAEQLHGLPDGLLGRVLFEESRFRPEIIDGRKVSGAGALGIAQFMPATARDLGVDPLDPQQAIPGAARYLRRLFDALGTWTEALAAYNWGIGNVRSRGIAAAPRETRNYVAAIAADVEI